MRGARGLPKVPRGAQTLSHKLPAPSALGRFQTQVTAQVGQGLAARSGSEWPLLTLLSAARMTRQQASTGPTALSDRDPALRPRELSADRLWLGEMPGSWAEKSTPCRLACEVRQSKGPHSSSHAGHLLWGVEAQDTGNGPVPHVPLNKDRRGRCHGISG